MKPMGSRSFSLRGETRLTLIRLVTLTVTCSFLAACGGALYAVEVNSAAGKLAEAERLDAAKLAPYEYYSAKVRLEKAREEAAEANYGDAIKLSDESEAFSEKAVTLAREGSREAGR
jgi:hypothetical protein